MEKQALLPAVKHWGRVRQRRWNHAHKQEGSLHVLYKDVM